MIHLLILAVHLLATIVKLVRPGGVRAVVAESLVLKHQLLISSRARRRAPNLNSFDRFLLGLGSLFVPPSRIPKLAVILKSRTLFRFHEALKKCKYRWLFSSGSHRRPGPKGPSKELIDAIIEIKRRNPRSGPGMAFSAKGSPAIAVAAFAGPPRNISAIVLHNSAVDKIADLKRKLIAVSTTGSLSDWLAKQMAIQEGWGQDGIRAVPLGAIPTSIAALKTRQVDAVVLATEAGFRLEEQKEGRVLATMDRYAPNFITHVMLAQKSLIANNPGLVT